MLHFIFVTELDRFTFNIARFFLEFTVHSEQITSKLIRKLMHMGTLKFQTNFSQTL